jgi:sugar O-acyltransferase (sialic acid O-acetyltransferase NeuD family)
VKKCLIGAGGFAREIRAHLRQDIPCFIDDCFWVENKNEVYKISSLNIEEYEVLIAVGDPKNRFEIFKKLPKKTKYFSFIHPSAQILDNNIEIGHGSIVCANSILTTNIKIGNHCHINLATTIGHDCIVGDFFTTAPGAHVSGNCEIGDFVYLGTNSSIKEKIKICNNVTIGLNSGVVKNIIKSGVYVGTPAIEVKKQ